MEGKERKGKEGVKSGICDLYLLDNVLHLLNILVGTL